LVEKAAGMALRLLVQGCPDFRFGVEQWLLKNGRRYA
jgi:hypothetical protein